MAKDYGSKRSSRQRGSTPQQFLVIIVTFLLGYLTASVFDVGTISQWMNSQVLAHHQVKQPPPPKATAQQSQLPPKPKFEFYTLLANEKAGATAQANVNTASNHQTNTAIRVSPTQPVSHGAVVAANATHAQSKTNPVKNQQPTPVKVADAKPANPRESKGNYLVQVASFKMRQDAEHMKGMLILKGFNVNVVPVSQARGNWFRVVVGPYSNRGLAEKAQLSLARNERLRGMVTSAG